MAEKKVAKTTEAKPETKQKEVEKEIVVDDSKDLEIEALKKQLAEALNKPAETPVAPVVQTVVNENNKNIKVISLMNHDFTLSTTNEYGKIGKLYTFNKFGDSKLIKYSYMLEVIEYFGKYFENGSVLIANRDDAVLLGIEDIYDSVADLSTMKEIVKLHSFDDVDFILGLPKDMQENIATMIAENIVDGYGYNISVINELEDNGLRINELAKAIKGYREDEKEAK